MLLMLSLLEASFRDWGRLFFIPDLIAAMLRCGITLLVKGCLSNV
jgi:hypothetical protein